MPKETPAAQATHFSYAGAKYEIPDALHLEWLKMYAAELERNTHSLYLIERRTPVFRMHFDLDILQMEEATPEDALTYARLFSGVFRSFYPTVAANCRTFVCIILGAPSKPARGWLRADDVEADIVVKTGFHLIWPWLCVSQEQSLRLRESCVVAATKHLPPRVPPMNPYADVIDESVLLTNGLRMVGSDKCAACKDCKGSGKNVRFGGDCADCAGARFLSENRRYMPVLVMDENGESNAAQLASITQPENLYDCVRLCSIRSSHKKAKKGYKPPPLAPPSTAVANLKAEQQRQRNRRPVTSDDREFRDDKASNGQLSDAEEISPGTLLFCMMQEFIQTRTGSQWADLEMKKFFLQKKSNRYLAKVKGMGASYCTNVNRAHGSSTIYFVVEPAGVSQRCYSKKEGLGDVPCKKYKGPLVELTAALRQALFAPPEAEPTDVVAKVAKGHIFEKELYGLHAAQKLASASRARKMREFEKERDLAASVQEQKEATDRVSESMQKKPRKRKAASDKPHPILSDLTCKEVDGLRCSDLIKRDRKHIEDVQLVAQLVRNECFNGRAPPASIKPVKRRAKKVKTSAK